MDWFAARDQENKNALEDIAKVYPGISYPLGSFYEPRLLFQFPSEEKRDIAMDTPGYHVPFNWKGNLYLIINANAIKCFKQACLDRYFILEIVKQEQRILDKIIFMDRYDIFRICLEHGLLRHNLLSHVNSIFIHSSNVIPFMEILSSFYPNQIDMITRDYLFYALTINNISRYGLQSGVEWLCFKGKEMTQKDVQYMRDWKDRDSMRLFFITCNKLNLIPDHYRHEFK